MSVLSNNGITVNQTTQCIGIHNSNPIFNLDVNGDVNISGDTYVTDLLTNTVISSNVGFQGLQGLQGISIGYQGNQGFVGNVLSQGLQGSQGNQGLQGSQGNSGFQGFQGIFIGYQGFQGFQGSQGLQGFQGFQGFPGRQGRQGFQGSQGFQGFQGIVGFQGFQGLQGSQGFQGNQGNQGFHPTLIFTKVRNTATSINFTVTSANTLTVIGNWVHSNISTSYGTTYTDFSITNATTFTTPVSGVYIINLRFGPNFTGNLQSYQFVVGIRINETDLYWAPPIRNPQYNGVATFYSGIGFWVLPLAQNDTIQVVMYSNTAGLRVNQLVYLGTPNATFLCISRIA